MLMVPVRREADWSAHHDEISLSAVTMAGKFESQSNKYAESNVNPACSSRQAGFTCKGRCWFDEIWLR
jgi:hypothetical protein